MTPRSALALDLDQDHTQWQAVLELLDNLDSVIPDGDPFAGEIHRHLATVAAVVRFSMVENRRSRAATRQETFDLEGVGP